MKNSLRSVELFEQIIRLPKNLPQKSRRVYISNLLEKITPSQRNDICDKISDLQFLKIRIFFDDQIKTVIKIIKETNILEPEKTYLITLFTAHHNRLVDCIIHSMQEAEKLIDRNA